jgi:hypothetical protein
MIYKFQYNTEEEKTKIMSDNISKILLEVQNIKEGNFLIFSDTPRTEEQVNSMRSDIDWLVLKQKGLV